MKKINYREVLINSVVSVVAREGLENATTKAIVKGTDVNEAYIYRFFKDKEDLFAQTFAYLDEIVVSTVIKKLEVMQINDMSYETRCWLLFSSLWKFLLNDKERCFAYIRYYYSPYYNKKSAKDHVLRSVPLIRKIYRIFDSDTDAWVLIKHCAGTMLTTAMMVNDGELEDNNETAERLFRIIYSSVSPHFVEKETIYEKNT